MECNVLELTKNQAIECAFIENIQRENLTPIEEARMFKTLLKNFPKNSILSRKSKILEISNKIDYSETTISERLNLLVLPESLQIAIENETLDAHPKFNERKGAINSEPTWEISKSEKISKISKEVHKSSDTVKRQISLLRLPKEIQTAIVNNK